MVKIIGLTKVVKQAKAAEEVKALEEAVMDENTRRELIKANLGITEEDLEAGCKSLLGRPVTPEVCRLLRLKVKNRNINKKQKDGFVLRLKDGTWDKTPSGEIWLDKDWNLVGGGHTTMASVEADKPIHKAAIIFNVSPETRSTLDTQLTPMRPSGSFEIAGLSWRDENSANTVSIANQSIETSTKSTLTIGGAAERDHQVLLDYCRTHRGRIQASISRLESRGAWRRLKATEKKFAIGLLLSANDKAQGDAAQLLEDFAYDNEGTLGSSLRLRVKGVDAFLTRLYFERAAYYCNRGVARKRKVLKPLREYVPGTRSFLKATVQEI